MPRRANWGLAVFRFKYAMGNFISLGHAPILGVRDSKSTCLEANGTTDVYDLCIMFVMSTTRSVEAR